MLLERLERRKRIPSVWLDRLELALVPDKPVRMRTPVRMRMLAFVRVLERQGRPSTGTYYRSNTWLTASEN